MWTQGSISSPGEVHPRSKGGLFQIFSLEDDVQVQTALKSERPCHVVVVGARRSSWIIALYLLSTFVSNLFEIIFARSFHG